MLICDWHFDGSCAQSTNSPECFRRSSLHVTVSSMLSNDKRLKIFLLSKKFETSQIITKHGAQAADTNIVNNAINVSKDCDSVVKVREDIDILVILTALLHLKIYFMKPGQGYINQNIESSTSF